LDSSPPEGLWDASAQGELAASRRRSATTGRDEAKVFGLDDFAHRRGVVHFRDIHVLGAEAGLLVCLLRGQTTDVALRLVEAAMGEACESRWRDLDASALIGADALQAVFVQRIAAADPSESGAHIGKVIGK